MAGPKHPRHYDEAFKRRSCSRNGSGKPYREIRAEYDIARSTLQRWVQGIRDSGSTRAMDNRTPEQNKRRRYSHEGRRDTGRRGKAREPDGPAGPTATPRTRIWRAILPMSASAEAGRTCACWSTWRTCF